MSHFSLRINTGCSYIRKIKELIGKYCILEEEKNHLVSTVYIVEGVHIANEVWVNLTSTVPDMGGDRKRVIRKLSEILFEGSEDI